MISDMQVLLLSVAVMLLFVGLCVRLAYLSGKWNCRHCNHVNKPWSLYCHWCGFEYREPTWR